MMRLFEGYRGAHGTHGKSTSSRGAKVEIKKSASTVREPVTENLWQKHLDGERALGVIPINEENMCHWGCIDVDKYDIDHVDVVKKLKDTPALVCKSKSGGVHVFVFFSEPIPAEDVKESLNTLAAAKGWGGSEVFPKQTQILAERGDIGNWLNMPYLGGDETDRYCVKENGLAMTLTEFLDAAEAARVDGLGFADQPENDNFKDGPPCLQHLTQNKFQEGTRNKGLFALGIYAKKKYGEHWREHLEELNRKFIEPPAPSEDVLDVQRRLEKKEYNYTCKDTPFCDHCELVLCRTRKFGVGGANSLPDIQGLSKLETDPPIWFLDIENKRIELDTSQLQEYRLFQKACMEQLTIFYMPMRAEAWAGIIGTAMEDAIIIEAPREMSVEGHFMELLESFCRDRHRGQRWADIFDGRPYYEEETKTHWFRLKDLHSLLERQGFRKWGRNKVGNYIREIGGQKGMHIEGKFVRLFWVLESVFENPDPDTNIPEHDDPL